MFWGNLAWKIWFRHVASVTAKQQICVQHSLTGNDMATSTRYCCRTLLTVNTILCLGKETCNQPPERVRCQLLLNFLKLFNNTLFWDILLCMERKPRFAFNVVKFKAGFMIRLCQQRQTQRSTRLPHKHIFPLRIRVVEQKWIQNVRKIGRWGNFQAMYCLTWMWKVLKKRLNILCHSTHFICFVSALTCSNLVKYLVQKAGSPEKEIPRHQTR